jgi:sulfur carrier protein ThiS adenylyltransferase
MNIGIAGVGGIGSNVAVNLVRSGIASLKIVDFDRVEPSNLNRQFYFHDQIGRLKVEALARKPATHPARAAHQSFGAAY